MFESVLNLNSWFVFFTVYLLIGFVLSKEVYGFVPKLMSSIGWPIEFTQKLFGTKSLPYLFLFPNILIFGLFTFLPLFMNFGFSVTDGTSINFESRDFSGLDNLARITQEVQIDTGGINVENDKFQAALYDTFVLNHYLYNVSLYLVDKSSSDVLEKDFKKKSINYREDSNEFAFYTNIECALDILSLNAPKKEVDVHSIDATTESLNALEYETFDMIYSLLSWGFHYSTRTYAAVSYKLLRNNGILLLTIRKPVESKVANLRSVGFSCKIVSKINRQQIKYSSKQYRSKYELVKCIKNM